MSKTSIAAIAVVVAAVAGGGAYYWWQQQQQAKAVAAAAASTGSADADADAASAPAAAALPASEPGIQHPIAPPVADAAAPPPSLDAALSQLIDRQTLLTMFQTQDLARRIVATIDNLGRSQAPITVWPINPMAGRFATGPSPDGATVVGADNAARYAAFVALVESVDLNKAVGIYRTVYPQLQQAYADLGFPKRYFNDRFVAVLDLLLATPEPAEPLKVHLPEINGPLKPERPWVLYEFDDPALQSLSSGQRMLLRSGPDNERRLKARIQELRRLLATGGAKP